MRASARFFSATRPLALRVPLDISIRMRMTKSPLMNSMRPSLRLTSIFKIASVSELSTLLTMMVMIPSI